MRAVRRELCLLNTAFLKLWGKARENVSGSAGSMHTIFRIGSDELDRDPT
jgi:hypothetical protein